MTQKFNLLSISLVFSLHAHAAECVYSFSLNDEKDEKKYTVDNISEFTSTKIRPQFGNKNQMIDIHIYESCQGKETVETVLGMNTKNYYLLTLNKMPLPEHIVAYNNRMTIMISRENLKRFISMTPKQDFMKFYKEGLAKSYSDIKEEITQQKIMKMYAFVFAESARFQSVETALKKSIEGNCTINWFDFDYALHNWSNMSYFVLNKDIKDKDQYAGGGRSQLLAPISMSQESAFQKALKQGEQYNFSSEAPFFGYRYQCGCTQSTK